MPGTVSLLWLKHCLVIFFLTFLHEDAAILAAAFSKVEHGLPVPYAYISVYLGIVSGDILIYGLGRLAQRNTWLKKKIIGPKVERIRLWLETHLVRILVLCRITPGLLFPTFVACGWFKIPFKRFAIVSIIAGAIYSSLALTIIILFGDLVLGRLGYWAWGTLLAIVIILGIRNALKPRWSKTTEQVFGNVSPSLIKVFNKYMPTFRHKFIGMPSLDGIKRFVSLTERLPNALIYLPIGIRWLLLSIRYHSLTLPTASNPMIETGGFWGESKSSIMNSVGENQQSWLAEYVTLNCNGKSIQDNYERALYLMENKGLSFPIVAKPDIGWQGYGVRLLEDCKSLFQYISLYPSGEKMLLQRFIPFDGEAGIFYVRLPGEPSGNILSLTLRYFPYVVGDGRSTLRELIQINPRTKLRSGFFLGSKSKHLGFSQQDLNSIPMENELIRLSFIGSIRVGGLYRDASNLISPELTKHIDTIARSMPEFYYGRIDVRFESTELLQAGEGFSIIEINGAGSEAIHAWDPEVPMLTLYRELFKAQSILFKIGSLNRARGFKPSGPIAFIKAILRQNSLIGKYPPAG
jgi:membrane protein DedA with SNARE-associated domain